MQELVEKHNNEIKAIQYEVSLLKTIISGKKNKLNDLIQEIEVGKKTKIEDVVKLVLLC